MATTVDQEHATKPARAKADETTLEFVASIAGVVVFWLFAVTFIARNMVIPSGSMLNTIWIGDHVVVDRETLAPPTKWAPFMHYRNIRRGDIVVFYKPGEPDTFLVKRVVGIPGDHIHLRNGVVYLNGKAQNEPWTLKSNDQMYYPYRDDFPAVKPTEDGEVTSEWAAELPTRIQGEDLVVPANDYFCMGDNRPNSLDSRYWGFVPRDSVIGRPIFVYWSFITSEEQQYKTSFSDHAAWVVHVATHFFSDTRWRRTLHPVH